jgi:hypothetical protein
MATRLNSRKGEGSTPTGRGERREVRSKAENTAPVRPKTDSPVALSGKATEPLSLIAPKKKDIKNAEKGKVSKLRALAPITVRTSAAPQESKISPPHVEGEGSPAEGNVSASKILHIKPPLSENLLKNLASSRFRSSMI